MKNNHKEERVVTTIMAMMTIIGGLIIVGMLGRWEMIEMGVIEETWSVLKNAVVTVFGVIMFIIGTNVLDFMQRMRK